MSILRDSPRYRPPTQAAYVRLLLISRHLESFARALLRLRGRVCRVMRDWAVRPALCRRATCADSESRGRNRCSARRGCRREQRCVLRGIRDRACERTLEEPSWMSLAHPLSGRPVTEFRPNRRPEGFWYDLRPIGINSMMRLISSASQADDSVTLFTRPDQRPCSPRADSVWRGAFDAIDH
jgi:hypothetical protein